MITPSSSSDRGGVLIVTDPPPSFDFGIDCMHYETGPEFRGVCMIPPGLHFVYYSTGSTGSRQGFFLMLEKDDVVVKSWDRSTEDIAFSPQLSDDTLQELIAAVHLGRMDKQLGPYPVSELKSWQNLSSFITTDTLRLGGALPHTPLFPGDSEDLPTSLQSTGEQQEVQPYFPDAARIVKFCNIKEMEIIVRDAILQSENGSGCITSFYIDKSDLLEYIVSNYFSGRWEGLLGELQLSFVVFMLLFSYPALQQWKLLVDTICRCERVLLTHQDFAAAFVRVFYQQLQFSPSDFFETEISTDNFLRPAVSNLFEILTSEHTGEYLQEHKSRLLLFMTKKFGLYDEGTGRDPVGDELLRYQMDRYNIVIEDLPVVVDIMEGTPVEEAGTEREKGSVTSPQSWAAHQSQKAAIESAIDEVIPVWGQGGVQESDLDATMTTPAEEMTQGVGGDDCEESASQTHEMRVRRQEAMFSWRYPALFEAMVAHNSSEDMGKEDLTMTAARLMDEADEIGGGESVMADWSSAYAEAVRFVADEMSRWDVT